MSLKNNTRIQTLRCYETSYKYRVFFKYKINDKIRSWRTCLVHLEMLLFFVCVDEGST